MNGKNKTGLFGSLTSSVSECGSYCYNKSKEATVNSGKFVALWCVLKLLNVSKTVENITNARSPSEANGNKEVESEPSTSKEGSPSKSTAKSRSRKQSRVKSNESLSDTIKTSIQEAAEECMAEEAAGAKEKTVKTNQQGRKLNDKDSTKKKEKSVKKKPFLAKTTPVLNSQTSQEDTIGYSFFPTKSVPKPPQVEKQNPKKIPQQKKLFPDPNTPIENIGFSFIPVKDKKNAKRPTKEKLNEKVNVEPNKHISRLPVQHNQPYRAAVSSESTNQTHTKLQKSEKTNVQRKFIDTVDKSSEYVVVNKVEENHGNKINKNLIRIVNRDTEKSILLPVKESKKVDASLSYARVTSQNFKADNFASLNETITTNVNGTIGKEEISKVSPGTEKVDVCVGIKHKLELFEKLAESQKVQRTEIEQGPEVSRLHKIILAEAEKSNQEQVFEHFGVITNSDEKSDSLILQNIEKSEKKSKSLVGNIDAFLRTERSEVVNLHNYVEKGSKSHLNATEENKTQNLKTGNLEDNIKQTELKAVDVLVKPNNLNSEIIPDTFHSILEFLERENINSKVTKKSHNLTENYCVDESCNNLTESNLTESDLQLIQNNPLVLEKTFEIFEKPQSLHNFDSGQNCYTIVEKKSKLVESDQQIIVKESYVEETFAENSTVAYTPTNQPSVIETSTIIDTSPPIEASTIIETFPNLGNSPIIETSTVVTSLTDNTPFIETSTIIESFPLRSCSSLLETSTIIVTSSKTQSTPVVFETSAIIESLPDLPSNTLIEALTCVETPSQSEISVDVTTSSIIETLPELNSSDLATLANSTLSDENILLSISPSNILATNLQNNIKQGISEKQKEQPFVESKSSNPSIEENSVHCKAENFNETISISDFISNKKREVLSEQNFKDFAPEYKMSSNIQIRVLTLNDQENQESTLYRIQKNWILEFHLGPSLLGRKILLYCNYPQGKNGNSGEFDRNVYHLLPWSQDEGCEDADDTALKTQIIIKISGSFHYYFVYEDSQSDLPQGSGCFLVDPVLQYGDNEELPLNCIQCQTVISKGLGPFSTWEAKLRVAKESGYNMIHFTPIQELGNSNSAYSLRDQLKLNKNFKDKSGKELTFDDIEKFVEKMRKEWKMPSICDIVLNHTANESKWIQEHPETTYNCLNCPYLRPAYLLDAALYQFSVDVTKGFYETKGIPIEVNSEDCLNAIRYHFKTDVLSPLNIPELFMCDTNKYVTKFLELARKMAPFEMKQGESRQLKLLQDPKYRRLASTVDLELALQLYNIYRTDCFDEESRLKKCSEEFKKKLDTLNELIEQEINKHLDAAVENCIASIRYFRVQHDGPKVKEVSAKHPLVYRYFTDYGTLNTLEEHETIMYSENSKYLMAHNGWIINASPLENFAAPGTMTYIRRELIVWGDSVKLRYGDKPQDCPYLWNHMRQYVEQTAQIFDGVRLDNCHSTPIPVAEYLLDCARQVRPDLYVVAELFTNSDATDNFFVNKLGISSLIREAMSAWDAHEEGRLVHRYGGYPVGSFYQPNIRPLVRSIAHALFLDWTHDNPSPVDKRSVFDMLPSTALVNMSCCASGSNRGYDELVPHHIHVVDETREYTEWTDDEKLAETDSRYVSKNTGIIAAKRVINNLHYQLGRNGYDQVYVDQIDPDVVAVTRHSPELHHSYILVAFTAFHHPHEGDEKDQRYIRPLCFEGVLDEIVVEATISHKHAKTGSSKYTKPQNFEKDDNYINGYSEYEIEIRQNIEISKSKIFEKVISDTHNLTQLNFKDFKPGSIVIIKTSLPTDMKESIENVRNLIRSFSLTKETELTKIIDQMTLADLNRALYRCDQEEKDEGNGFSVYNIPNFGPMVYSGLQGFMSLLASIRPQNDLGHPMCRNIREGNWMIDYIWQRLKVDEGSQGLGEWFEENTKSLKAIPRYLIPCYLDVIITGVYVLLLEQSYKLMSNFVKNGSTFVRGLSLGSVQCAGYIKSSDLPVLSPDLAEPKPIQRKDKDGTYKQACVSLSAGLPHFSVGYMRNWSRDTFISLRGLFIITGRYQETRYHILAYGQCLRHGLIPNLLDGGRNSRYNCRDAVWWWLHCIKSYTEEAPNGTSILQDQVSRIFPTDDSTARSPGEVDQPLYQVIQEALTVHFQGLAFRERNAGKQIDEHMTDKGFNNQIGVHPETGFVFGGNEWNCGTWMDKMGSSDKSGNRGKPATPRDGSAIELIGLSKSVISWLDNLHKQKLYPYDGVERTHKNGCVTKWTFNQWADKIQNNFEKLFWINSTPIADEVRPDLINKRGIYKDCYGASQAWTDYQLRCNVPIAMVVAPELFDPQHAWVALNNVEKYLLGPLGMKTLDPDDWAYDGNYDNSNDSNDPKVACGFNYHQGPEWIWPMGFFLRAKLIFAEKNGHLMETLAKVKVILSRHYIELQTSPWRGLPELTNSNGAYCFDSSKTQAWSMSCILEVLYDLQKI